MTDNRFPNWPADGVDARFPSVEVDARFAETGVDARFLAGVDTRFEGDVYAFSPTFLFANGEVGAWYDPSPTTTFTDTARTTPAAVGDAVAGMTDLSGNGFHATQSVLAARPILRQLASGQHYLEFDGSNDSMQAGPITPGANSMQIFAAARKNSDAVAGMVAELSTSRPVNAGAFSLLNPAPPARYNFVGKGTLDVVAQTVNTIYNAPQTAVLTGIANIAAPLTELRVNNVVAATSGSSLGTGNFNTHSLFIGSRNNASLFFNGRIYSLILRFGPQMSDLRMQQATNYAAAKTEGVAP
jgi:hypothetical protein